MTGSWRRTFWLCAGLFALALAVSATALPDARFVWDDLYVIENNPAITDMANIPSFFTTSWAQGTNSAKGQSKNVSFYRPIAQTMYTVQFAAWGANPTLFRLSNGMLHGGVTVMVLLFLMALGLPARAAGIGAALFAVHPVHTEVINVVSYGTTLLVIFFYLSALAGHLRWNGDSLLCNLLVPALALLALLSKESGATLPLALVVLDVTTGRRISPGYALRRYLPTLIVLGVYLWVRAGIVSPAPGAAFAGMGKHVVLFTMLKVVLLYARVLTLPWPLCAYYDPTILTPTDSPFEWAVAGGLAVIAVWAGVTWYVWRKQRRLAGLMLLIPLGLAPYLHLVPFRVLAGERFLYLSSAFFCGLVGYGLWQLGTARWKKPAMATAVALVVIFAGLSIQRNRDWKDNTAIMSAKVRDFPNSFDGQFSLGQHLLVNQQDPAAALPHLQQAVKIWPGFAPARQALERARSLLSSSHQKTR